MKLFFHRPKSLLHFLFPIITLFLFPPNTLAVGRNCLGNQVFISGGRIIVVQTITDMKYLDLYKQGRESYTIEVLYTPPIPDKTMTTTNQIEIINNKTIRVTYTLNQYWSQTLADLAAKQNGSLEGKIDLKILGYGEKKFTDSIGFNCEFDLDASKIEKIKNPEKGNTVPSGACSSGCPQGQFCQYSGTGKVDDPANWSCQADSLSNVDVHGSCGSTAIDTAIGCIPLKADDFTLTLVRYAIGLAGLAALVIMIIASILIVTGGSNPEQVKKGKEIFTSAVMGLLFIIFSAVILKIINQDILGNPLQTQTTQTPVNFNNQQSPYSDTIRQIRQQQGGSL